MFYIEFLVKEIFERSCFAEENRRVTVMTVIFNVGAFDSFKNIHYIHRRDHLLLLVEKNRE